MKLSTLRFLHGFSFGVQWPSGNLLVHPFRFIARAEMRKMTRVQVAGLRDLFPGFTPDDRYLNG